MQLCKTSIFLTSSEVHLALGLGEPKKSVYRNYLFFEQNFRMTFFRPKFLFFQPKFLMTIFVIQSFRRWVDISYDIKYFSKILGGRKHRPSPTSNLWVTILPVPLSLRP